MSYSQKHIGTFHKWQREGSLALTDAEVSVLAEEDRALGLHVRRERTEAADKAARRYTEAERRYADADRRATAPPSSEPAIDWEAWHTACEAAIHAEDAEAAWRAMKAFVRDFKGNDQRVTMVRTARPLLAAIWAMPKHGKARDQAIATLQTELAAVKAERAADAQLDELRYVRGSHVRNPTH
jgi:hypothetical protein